MADIAAPYFSGNDLTARAGNADLSGVAGNFDPSIKNPSQPLQQTFERLGSERFRSNERKANQEHDILKTMMAYDHEDKVRALNEGLQNRERMYNMFNKTGATAASLKDDEGNDMSIPFLPEDDKVLNDKTMELQTWAMSSPTKNLYSPELKQKLDELKVERSNASLRTIYYRQAQQKLQNTYNPQERKRIEEYMNALKTQKLSSKDMPDPFVAMPTVKPIIDPVKEYKDGKGFESFGENGEGIPNSRYLSLGATTDPQMIEEGFKRYSFFKNQPQGQNAKAYQKWKEQLDNITSARDLPPIDIPVSIGQNGEVLFDDDTYAKKQEISRLFLAASELMNNGYLQPQSEEEQLKIRKAKADLNKSEAGAKKDLIEAQIKQKELETGKPVKPTTEQMKQQQTVKAVKSTYNDVKSLFNQGKSPKIFNDKMWSKNGINPETVDAYRINTTEANKYIGIEKDQVTTKKTERSGETKETTVKGSSETADIAYLVKDKQTGESRIVYFKDGKIIAQVSQKDAVVNGLKASSKYDPKQYEGKVAWVDEIWDNAEKDVDNKSDNENAQQEDDISARLVPVTLKKPDGTVFNAMKDPKTGEYYEK